MKKAVTLTPRVGDGREENRRGEDEHFVQASHVVRSVSGPKRDARRDTARAAPEQGPFGTVVKEILVCS